MIKSLIKRHLVLLTILLISTTLYSNTPPKINTLPVTLTRELDYYNYLISAVDNEQDSLIFKCLKKPTWLNFDIIDKKTASLSGMPKENYSTNGDSIIISVSDGELVDTQKFVLFVDYVAIVPWFVSKPDTIAYGGQQYQYLVDIYAVQPNYVTIDCIEKPDWLNFKDNSNGKAELIGTPSLADTANIYDVKIKFSYASSIGFQEFKIKVSKSTGVFIIEKKSKILIYPNPTQSFCMIEGCIGSIDITLFDETGTTLRHLKSVNRIDLSDYSTGLYIIKIDSNNDSNIYRVIKK